MDFSLNGTAVAYSVGYANYTSYLPVASGPLLLAATRVGSAQALATMQGSVMAGRQYTAVVSHGLGSLHVQLYDDQEGTPPAGQIGVRILNAMDGPGALTVYVSPAESSGSTAAPTVLNVMSGGASGYLTLPANNSYTVRATIGEGGLRFPLSTVTLKASAGAARTVVFGGVSGVGGRGAVGFALSDDAF